MKIYLSLIFLIASFAPSLAQQPDTKSAILRVKISTAKGPAIGALVAVSGQSANNTVTEQGFTNEAGEWESGGLPTGAYSLSVVKPSFFIAAESANQLTDIYLTNGQSKTLNLTLTAGATITGRLLDNEGNPVIGLPVSALKINAPKSHNLPPKAESNAVSLSNDQGLFRVYGLRPGNYLLAINTERQASLQKTVLPFYYPNQVQPEKAISIVVGLGQEVVLPDVQVPLNEPNSYSLTGIVRGVNRIGLSGVIISLAELNEEAISDTVQTTADGQFGFEGLTAGKYRLTVKATGQPYFNAEKELTLTNSSLNNLAIDLPSYPVLTGNTYLAQAGKITLYPNLDIKLVSPESRLNLSFKSDSNGKFSLNFNQDGPFYWDFPTLEKEYYIEQVTVANKEATNQPLVLSKTTSISTIAIYAHPSAAQITGQLPPHLADGCQKFAVYAVALNNATPSAIARFRRANTCLDNSFSIYSLAPESYYLIAVPMSLNPLKAPPASAETLADNTFQTLAAFVKKIAFNKSDALTLTQGQKYAGATNIIILTP